MWSKFEYMKPGTLGEALDILSKHKREVIIYAGGTDVLVSMREGEIKPKYVIDIKGLKDLNKIKTNNGQFSLGTLVTWSALMNSGTLQKRIPILCEAAKVFGSPQIRNKATIGGNICTASPSCDLGPVLLVLDAELMIVGKRRKRTIPIKKFFLKRKETSLAKNEILSEILVKAPSKDTVSTFLKHRRTGVDLAIVNVAVVAKVKKNKFESIKIALGGVAPTPIRAVEAEEKLKGAGCTDENIETAAEIASGETRPISDVRASAEYRKELAKVLVKRAIKSALEKMGG